MTDSSCESDDRVHGSTKRPVNAQVLFWRMQEAKQKPRYVKACRLAKKKRERKVVS